MITASAYQEIICKIDNANQSRLSILQRLTDLRTSLPLSGLSTKNFSKIFSESYNLYINFANNTAFYQNVIYLINKNVFENYSSLDNFILENNIFHTTYTAELSLNVGFTIPSTQIVPSCAPSYLVHSWNNFTYENWNNFTFDNWDNFIHS